MNFYDVIRFALIVLAVITAALSAYATYRNMFPANAAKYLRFLRIGNVGLLLTVAYASTKAYFQDRLVTETTIFFLVFTIWSFIGAVGTIIVERRGKTTKKPEQG